MLSMSSDVNNPGAREVVFDQVYQAYREQIKALNDGGVHMARWAGGLFPLIFEQVFEIGHVWNC